MGNRQRGCVQWAGGDRAARIEPGAVGGRRAGARPRVSMLPPAPARLGREHGRPGRELGRVGMADAQKEVGRCGKGGEGGGRWIQQGGTRRGDSGEAGSAHRGARAGGRACSAARARVGTEVREGRSGAGRGGQGCGAAEVGTARGGAATKRARRGLQQGGTRRGERRAVTGGEGWAGWVGGKARRVVAER